VASAVLIVDRRDNQRTSLQRALWRHKVQSFDAPDAFLAMAALGRADFGALMVAEDRRLLSIRSLVRMARRRHPGIQVYVMLQAGSSPGAVREALDVAAVCFLPTVSAMEMGQAVVDRLANPSAPIAVDAPDDDGLVDISGFEAVVENAAGVIVEGAHSGPALLEGKLEGGVANAVLMTIFSQGFTGRLRIHGPDGESTLFFARGHPAYAEPPTGDAGLLTRMQSLGVIPADLRLPPGGLQELAENPAVNGDVIRKFLKAHVRASILAFCAQHQGGYRFREDPGFWQSRILCATNPFGLMVEARRKTMTPDMLLAEAHSLRKHHPVCGPALKQAEPRLASFFKRADVSSLIDGQRTVEDFWEDSGLGTLMGTLLLLTLAEARLVQLLEAPSAFDEGNVPLAAHVPNPDSDEPPFLLDDDDESLILLTEL